MQNIIYSTGTLINFHSERYHIQCGYFSSLKKKVPKTDQKKTTFFEKGDQDGTCSYQKRDSFVQSRFKDHILFEWFTCSNKENIVEPINSFVFRRYLYRTTTVHNDQFLKIHLARIFPYKTQNLKQCKVSPGPIKTETKKRYFNPVLILRFCTNDLSRARLGAVCDNQWMNYPYKAFLLSENIESVHSLDSPLTKVVGPISISFKKYFFH